MKDSCLAFKRVFRQGEYVFAAASVAFAALSVALLIPHSSILRQVWGSPATSVIDKLNFTVSLYGTLGSNLSLFSAVILLMTVALLGVNLAILVFYIRSRRASSGSRIAQATSLGGVVSAVLGVGCAACGSVAITALLALFGGGGLLLLFPLHGAEFGILGLVLLAVSTVYLLRRINDLLVCKPE